MYNTKQWRSTAQISEAIFARFQLRVVSARPGKAFLVNDVQRRVLTLDTEGAAFTKAWYLLILQLLASEVQPTDVSSTNDYRQYCR